VVLGLKAWLDIKATEEEHQEVIEKINRFKPQVLLVAFGHGKQERWMRMAKSRLKGRGLVIVGVGGVLDQIVDSRLRPPKMIEKIGLGWLYRVVRQPWRLKRLVRVVF
jgi:N-acetylglucosaminyldiphosphoundecaprenol N-acetyl-beta-D-mannosaminyltransferase